MKATLILTTTGKLSKDALRELTELALSKFPAEKVVHKADKSIVGGFIIQYDGTLYDMSIASRLKAFRATVTGREGVK